MKSIRQLTLWVISISFSVFSTAQNINKEYMIQNFDSGLIELESYPGEDTDPESWNLESNITYNNSAYSLKLHGDTWKTEDILNCTIDSGDVWQVAAYIASVSEIQGFGVMDENNSLFYSFAGSEEVEFENWMPVYQGYFSENQWNTYQLPIADDWLSLYGYLPEINKIVYVNDNDIYSPGTIYFDEISDISEDLYFAPQVSIDYSSGSKYYKDNGKKYIDIEFSSEVIDEDSENHDYYWYFGDGSESNEENPVHTYFIGDDHEYTVLLRVVDSTNKWGKASCRVAIDSGASSFPLKLNFVGDIMLARHFEDPGGIIPTQGVEAIFGPTKQYLGGAADITIANLECPLTTHWQHHPTKSIYFKGSPENIDGLTYAGIDVVTLANNHILDYMEPGMEETKELLDENGIIHSGAGLDSYEAYLPAYFSRSGVNFAFLSASDRTGQYNNSQPYLNAGYNKAGFGNLDEYYMEKQINQVKSISDLVVMEWHCGYEYSTEPFKTENSDIEEEDYSPYIMAPSKSNRSIRQLAIDKGADLVICHHPHITHGLELYNGKLIAHSLGNFVFDLYYPETMPTMILNAEVDESGFYEFSITPAFIDDYIPQRAEGELGLHILNDLANRSKVLDTYLNIDRLNSIAYVIMDTTNMNLDETDYIRNSTSSLQNSQWLSKPIELQTSGSITSVNQIAPLGEHEFRLGRERIWFGNMEDEGCSLWDMNNSSESFCDTAFYEGRRSIQHVRNELSPYNLVTNLEQRIICRSDDVKYSLAGYIKTKNAKNVTIEVQYFENRTSTYIIGEENIGASITGDTDWTFYEKELNIPAGTEFFDIRLNSGIPDEDTSYAWFDNVSLIQWNDWNEFEIDENIPAPNDFYFLQIKSAQNPGEITAYYTETGYSQSYEEVKEIIKPQAKKEILTQNAPNPFNPYFGPTYISFNNEQSSKVRVGVYNSFGKLVKIITEQNYPEGIHTIQWDGRNENGNFVSPGIYIYQFENCNRRETKKCMVVYN